MGILNRLFESKKAREEREEAERIADENEAKRRAAKEAHMPKCERCGGSAERLLPIQVRAHGTDSTVDLKVCSDCFHKAASMAEGIGFDLK